jgi:hypothetical protein
MLDLGMDSAMEKSRMPLGLKVLWVIVAVLLFGLLGLGLLDDGTIDGPWGWAPNNIGLKLDNWRDILFLLAIGVVPTVAWWLLSLRQRRSGS